MGTWVLSPQAKGVPIRMVLNRYMSPWRYNFQGAHNNCDITLMSLPTLSCTDLTLVTNYESHLILLLSLISAFQSYKFLFYRFELGSRLNLLSSFLTYILPKMFVYLYNNIGLSNVIIWLGKEYCKYITGKILETLVRFCIFQHTCAVFCL